MVRARSTISRLASMSAWFARERRDLAGKLPSSRSAEPERMAQGCPDALERREAETNLKHRV